MADLAVTRKHLDTLAVRQDQASEQAGSATAASANLAFQLWVSHGVANTASNLAFTEAENARSAAGTAMQQFAADLAEKLRIARQTYANVDADLGENIDNQVLPG